MGTDYSDIGFRTLWKEDITDVYLVFYDAYQDYSHPVHISLPDFKHKFLNRLSMRFDLSAGAFYDGNIIGFSLATEFQGIVYLSCSGVRPEWRNRHVLSRLLEFQLKHLSEFRYEECVLEVLCANEHAIKIYNNIGFKVTRKLTSFRAAVHRPDTPAMFSRETDMIPWETVLTWVTCEIPFANSQAVLGQENGSEKILVKSDNAGLAGILVFDPASGRISQLIVRPDCRGKGIASELLMSAMDQMRCEYSIFLNQPEEAVELRNFLEKKGFVLYSEMFEMKKAI